MPPTCKKWTNFLPLRAALISFAFSICSPVHAQERFTGIVDWFDATIGYGLIKPQGGGGAVFVYLSEVERAGLSTLIKGQPIEYEIIAERGKQTAVGLKIK